MAEPPQNIDDNSENVSEYKGPDKCNEKIATPEDEIIMVGSDESEATAKDHVDFLGACARCHKNFIDTKHNPKLLPCLHSLCESCLIPTTETGEEKTFDNQGTSHHCPHCNLPYNSQNVLDNMYIQDLLKEAKPEEMADGEPTVHECTGCEEKELGTSFCIDCSEWLCDQCVTAHKRVRVTKDHKIVPKDEVPKTDTSNPAECFLYCKLHKHEKLMFFCEKCDKLTCRDCQLVEHKDHKYQFIDVAAKDLQKTLQDNRQLMNERSKKINQVNSVIQSKLNHVKQQHAQIVKQVQDQADGLIKQIIHNARQLLQDVKVACEAMARKLAKEGTHINQILEKYDFCLKFVDELTQSGNNMALLLSKSVVVNECGRVYTLPIETQTVKNQFNVQYRHDNKVLHQNLHRFGAIYVNNQRFSVLDKNNSHGSQPPHLPTYNPPPSYTTQMQSEEKRQQLYMSMQKHTENLVPRMHSLLKVQQQQQQHMQNNGIPPQVSSLVSQMRMATQPVGNWQVQSLVRQNTPNILQHVSYPPRQQQPPFQPMRLQHRPATQQSVYSNSQHAHVTQSAASVRMSTGQPHPQTVRGPPPLIPSPNQVITSPANNRPSSAGPSTTRPSSNDNTTLPSGVRIKQERRSSFENDCVITGVKVKGEPRTQAPACSGPPTKSAEETEPSLGVGSRSSEGGSPGCSSTLAGVSEDRHQSSYNETEKNLEKVIQDLPIDELPSVEEIDTHLLTSSHINKHLNIAEKTRLIAQSPGKGGGDVCISDPNEDYCACCHNGGEVLCCDECPKVFHLQCHIPPLTAVPNGVFVCTLCSTGDNIRISSPIPDDMCNGSKRKAPGGLSDKQIKVCERLMLELFCNSNSVAFHEPVSKQVPNYYKIIQTPMDFTTIKLKLARQHFNHYNCIEDFLADVKLVFQNCATYNQEHSEVGKAGKVVRAAFEELVAKYLPPYMKFASTYPPRQQTFVTSDGSSDPKRPKTDDNLMHIA